MLPLSLVHFSGKELERALFCFQMHCSRIRINMCLQARVPDGKRHSQ